MCGNCQLKYLPFKCLSVAIMAFDLKISYYYFRENLTF